MVGTRLLETTLCGAVLFTAALADGPSAGVIAASDDGDGLSECGGDCNDADGTIWGVPGQVLDVRAGEDELGTTVLTWSAPADAGGLPAATVYDVIRAEFPYERCSVTHQTCLVIDSGVTGATDSSDPDPGGAFFYMVRPENDCPAAGLMQDPPPERSLRAAIQCEP